MQFFLYLFFDAVGNGLYMSVGIAFADDEEICRGIAQFAQVKLNDFLAFFVTNPLHDEVIELFEFRLICPAF